MWKIKSIWTGYICLTVIATLLGGCKDETEAAPECAPGTLNCTCKSDGTCGAGLSCVDNTCVAGTDTVDLDTGIDTFWFGHPDAGCEPTRDATLKADEDGWVEACNNRFGLQGVWYPYDDNKDGGTSKIEIDFTEAASGKICASGEGAQVPYDFFGTYWGAGIGVNICSTAGDNSVDMNLGECTLYDERTNIIGFRLNITGDQLPSGGSELRVNFKETERNESAYLVVQGEGVADYLFAEAEVTYAVVRGDTDVEGTHPELVEGVQFQVSTVQEQATPFHFCVSDLEPILEGMI